MNSDITTVAVKWDGPYSWPGFEVDNNLNSIPDIGGLYLQTFKYQGGYLIYSAGLTRRSVPRRFKEHTREYVNGGYYVLDILAAQQGIRKEVWRGWGYARKHRDEFEENKSIILDAVREQLIGFCIFIADIGKEPRLLERLEASIMNNLYQQPPPICDIPDKGMQLSSRWKSEDKITIRNSCSVLIHGLPASLEI